MNSDTGRALGALITAAILATGVVQALPAMRDAGWIAAPEAEAAGLRSELLYAVINLTDGYDALRACPLDLEEARTRVETGLSGAPVIPVYTPIAEGPDVLVHEVEARLKTGADGETVCAWHTTTLYGGNRHDQRDELDLAGLETQSRLALSAQAAAAR